MSARSIFFETIAERRKSKARFSGLPNKKQRTTQRAERAGKVKVFTQDEIFLYKLEQFRRFKDGN